MDFTTVLSSGVLAALVSGLVALRMNERRYEIENITQERTKWRDTIRRINIQIQESFQNNEMERLNILCSELRLLLNPMDPLDEDILNEIDIQIKSNSPSKEYDKISIKLSLLLKHDWERAKQEAKKSFYNKEKNMKRTTYDEYIRDNANK